MIVSNTTDQPSIDLTALVGQQDGYLPIPLRSIQWEQLGQLDFYIQLEENYVLYRSKELQEQMPDQKTLLKNGVEYAYVSASDHQVYYRTMEACLDNIVTSTTLEDGKKAEMLYSTCIALIDEIFEEPPQEADICRIRKLAGAIVKLLIRNKEAFGYLYDVANHDFYTTTHMVNVAMVSVGAGIKLQLDYNTILELGTGALLHDVGKLFVSSELLHAQRRLTPDELQQVRDHARLGYEYLKGFSDLSAISLAAIGQHHERLDGSGYPLKLTGKDISLYGQIVGLADSFEAMTSVRPYRSHTYSVEEALGQLDAECGSKWIPKVFFAFRELIYDDLVKLLAKRQMEDIPNPKSSGGHIQRMKRCYFRLPMEVRSIIKDTKGVRLGRSERFIAHNISCSGIGLLSQSPLEIGQNIHITLPTFAQKDVKPLLAFIVRCKDHEDGWYGIGARFLQMQTEEMIDHIRTVTLVADEKSPKRR